MKLIILTGVTKGLGNALYRDLLKAENSVVVSIGRNRNSIDTTDFFIKYDLFNVSPDSITKKLSKVIEEISFDEIFFINNAAVIEPIAKIGGFGELSLIQAENINSINPKIIINFLVSLKSKLTIFNITTGAIKNEIAGWSIYSSTKLSLKKYLDILNKENENVEVINFDPGVIDTDMQRKIRNTDKSDFPLIEQFNNYYLDGKLQSAEIVSQKIIKKLKL